MKIEFEYESLSYLYKDIGKLQSAALLTDSEGLIQLMNSVFIGLSGYEKRQTIEFGSVFFSQNNKPEAFSQPDFQISECLLKRKNENSIPVNLSRQELKVGKDHFFLFIVNPQASWQSEKAGHFDFLFENIEDGMILHDSQGNILKVNQPLAENLDYDIFELMQTNFSELSHALSKNEITRKIELLKDRRSVLYLSNLISRSGRIRPVEIHSKLMKYEGKETVLSLVRDISGRSLLENRLIRDKNAALNSESELQAVFDNVPSLILLFDKEYRIVRINSKALKTFGIKEKNALQKNIYDVIAYLDQEKERESVREVNFESIEELNRLLYNTVVRDEEITRREISFKYNSGDKKFTRTYLISTTRVEKQGEPLYLACIDDISERKETEMELVHAKEKAEESERLKSVFLENISHEIRTPLNGLLGFANFLMREGLSREKKKQFIDIINKSGKRLLQTIDKIVEMSKLKSGAIRVVPERIELIAELESFIGGQNHEFQRDNVLFVKNFNLERKNLVVKTDKAKLLQIINYLLDNAFKYTRVGFVELNVSLVKNNILFSIRDTGTGIAETDKESIFKAFRQGTENPDILNEGNGLGLTIAKTLVEKLGGEMWFESKLQEGTCFYFTLPYSPMESPEWENDKLKKSARILIFEPDSNEYEKIKKILRQTAIEGVQVKNETELLNKVSEREDIQGLILNSDLLDKNGNKNDIVKLSDNYLPVIILANREHRTTRFSSKPNMQFLERPFKPDDLIEKLRNLI